MSHHRFFVGHVLDVLKTFPDESVHCAVTSPPYWGLRDYGLPPVPWPEVEYAPMPGLLPIRIPAWKGQLGLEPSPEMYVAHLVLVFREVRRVLRRDGTLWLNLGDSYAGSWGNYHPYSPPEKHGQRPKETARWNRRAYDGREDFLPPTAKLSGGLKEKDLVGIPWRAAFALQAEGWWLRAAAPWVKANAMPESVRDRPVLSHETVFLLAKNKSYYFDAPAAAVHCRSGPSDVKKMRESLPRMGGKHKELKDALSKAGAATNIGQKRAVGNPLVRNRRSGDFWDESLEYAAACLEAGKRGGFHIFGEEFLAFSVNPEGFSGAHFAVFPRRLVEPCVQASTSSKACPVCGAPWERTVRKLAVSHPNRWSPEADARQFDFRGNEYKNQAKSTLGAGFVAAGGELRPGCSCPGNDGSGRCVVLDPFGGAGTTTLVAMELGRDSIYVDLSPGYLEIALNRCGFGDTLLDCHTFEVIEHHSSVRTYSAKRG